MTTSSPTRPLSVLGVTKLHAVDSKAGRKAADALSGNGSNEFQGGHPVGQIAAFAHHAAQFGGLFDGDAFADVEAGLAPDCVKPRRNAGRSVPHQVGSGREDRKSVV